MLKRSQPIMTCIKKFISSLFVLILCITGFCGCEEDVPDSPIIIPGDAGNVEQKRKKLYPVVP